MEDVAAQRVALEDVLHPLQLPVRELLDRLGDRPSARRRQQLPLELGLAGPTKPKLGS